MCRELLNQINEFLRDAGEQFERGDAAHRWNERLERAMALGDAEEADRVMDEVLKYPEVASGESLDSF
jgi:hypothetical protein